VSAVADSEEGENPVIWSPSSLAIDFGPSPTKKINVG